jgi:hypothetical protein
MPNEPLALRITAGAVSDADEAFLSWAGLTRGQVIGRPFEEVRRLPGQAALAGLFLPEKGKAIASMTDGKGVRFSVVCHAAGDVTELTFIDLTEIDTARAMVSRYVSKDMAGLSDEDKSTFSIPERRFMSVSFTDLRGFTAMSEKMSPEEVRETINAYLEVVMKAADENKATIDKIVGDEVMVLYGAPRHYRDHALRAVKTALDQQRN